MVGVNAIVAPTDEEAAMLFTSVQQRFLGMQRGRRGPLPHPVTPAQMDALWSPAEKAGVMRMLACAAAGGPDAVRHRLEAIVSRTGADELIVATGVHDHALRKRSYELLAGLAQPVAWDNASPISHSTNA
jgi:alkanesulfonate monooxygenase SsuD/methylene tetrahydromethanopterin reductase-like flavin-dependent oxidoreductase (luciferase family)